MILRKLLITLSIVIFLFAASAVCAEEWFNQLPDRFTTFETVERVNVKFLGHGSNLIATFYMKDGSCMQFLVMNDEIAYARKCGEERWMNYSFPKNK